VVRLIAYILSRKMRWIFTKIKGNLGRVEYLWNVSEINWTNKETKGIKIPLVLGYEIFLRI